jgi:hypothetical protein
MLSLLSLIGCGTQTSSVKNDQFGSELYSDKCGGCHRLHLKNEYTKAEWMQIMQVMKMKAKLSKNESSIIEQYLINP